MNPQPAWQTTFDFLGKTSIIVEPSQATLSSDGGLLPIRQFDETIGFTAGYAAALADHRRRPERARHTLQEMLRSRVYGIVAGYDDQNDHDVLRHDPIFRMVAGRRPDGEALASQPSLSRFENHVDIPDLKRLRHATVDAFLDSFETPPRLLTFDFDAVDDPCHGQQQLALFHAYYGQHQRLPLLVSNAETGQFVALTLRAGNAHAALGADRDLERLVRRVRARFPGVRIVLRGDCGFAVPALYDACAALDVEGAFGFGANAKLKKLTDDLAAEAERLFKETGVKQRLFRAFEYRAKPWRASRLTIVKAEHHAGGANRRFVTTNRPGAKHFPEAAYDEYVQRGEAENRNKEIKTDLGMDRLSDHRFKANFFRLYLHAAAHNLMARLRQAAALPPAPSPLPEVPTSALPEADRKIWQRRQRARDPFGRAQPNTWRTRLVKVAAEVLVSARRVVVRLAANWPYLDLYRALSLRLAALRPSG